MKKFILFAHVCTWWNLLVPVSLSAQDSLNIYTNYVVIGAFAVHNNAVQFTGDASNHRFPARFEMNPGRNLYYVYVLATDNRPYAIAEALRLRTETKYFDTWVYSGPLGTSVTIAHAERGVDVNPVTGRVVAVGGEQMTSPHTETDTADVIGTQNNLDQQAQARAFKSNRERAAALGPPPVRVSTEPLKAEETSGKSFYFHMFRADNHDMVDGEVDAIDFEKSRRMGTYKANSPVKVSMPSGKTKRISFLCQVFGYRKHQLEFDPASPSQDFYLDDKDNLVVPFELMRMQKGDIAIMYNVLFFKDAAVMRPESRYEISNLLDLLVENPTYRIRIHGHTNGNAAGKIIRMNAAGNFYSLSDTKQGFGSAKELSEERAGIIRDFLVSSGISADRMEVKAWGGKKPIHDKHSARAGENVRVEIEILSD